jgi:transcriptional regulator with XRE-family HTH domain
MHNPSTRELAVTLRNEGFAYSHISERTGLSKSTLSEWLSKIPYTPNRETVERVGKAIAASNARKTKIRQEETEKVRQAAFLDIGDMSKRDLFMFGLGLYLGEGAKTYGITRIVNADPNVIDLAIAWFHGFGVSREQFLLTIHLYPDSDVEGSLQFWSRTTTIPRSQFGKTQIDRRTNKQKSRAGKLPHGTAHLTVRSLGRKEFGVVLARRIQAWTDEVARIVKTRD